jgi:hypothetical protein
VVIDVHLSRSGVEMSTILRLRFRELSPISAGWQGRDRAGGSRDPEEWEIRPPGFISWAAFEANTARLRPPGAHHGDTEAALCGKEGAAAWPAALWPLREDHADRLLRPDRQPRYVCAVPSSGMPATTTVQASAVTD